MNQFFKRITLFITLGLTIFMLVGCTDASNDDLQPTFDVIETGIEVTSIVQGTDTVLTQASDPTKEGYTFGGWYTSETLETEYVLGTMPASDGTVCAKWMMVEV